MFPRNDLSKTYTKVNKFTRFMAKKQKQFSASKAKNLKRIRDREARKKA